MDTARGEIVFEVRCLEGEWPAVDYPRGDELSAFHPLTRPALRVNYGQGEGQVVIEGHEWGFYWNGRGSLDVIMHEPPMAPRDASAVVSDICDGLALRLGKPFAFRLQAP